MQLLLAFGISIFTGLSVLNLLRALSFLLMEKEHCTWLDEVVPCWVLVQEIILLLLHGVLDFIVCAWLCVSLCRVSSTALLLNRWWWTYGFFNLVTGLLYIHVVLICVIFGVNASYIVSYTTQLVSHELCAVVCFRPTKLVGALQTRLLSRGEAASAAAGVAELLGGRSSEEVLALARHRFLYVTADKLLKDDMADNVPNALLRSFTNKGQLGQADAFVSHSWHDDAQTKWATLQKWREEFKQKHRGREPKLWIDKYCIDQENIEESLACLPVFLAGCSKLLIICGKTYL
jgi:hypothetical protein